MKSIFTLTKLEQTVHIRGQSWAPQRLYDPTAPVVVFVLRSLTEVFTAVAMKILSSVPIEYEALWAQSPDLMKKRRLPCPWEFNLSRPSRSIVTKSTELFWILTRKSRPVILWLLSPWSVGLFYHLEDEDNTFLQNVSELSRTTERTSQKSVVFM
jgi:hypothetical protein